MTTAPERASLPPDDVATRLINGSVRRSYEPAVAIDWDAPLVEGKYFLPPEVISLYGTPYWDELSEEQRIDLSREELANVLSVGLWFENILNRGLLLQLLREDPASPFAHYVLTEMGDECRHMTMFGKVIDHVGARPYRMGRVDRFLAAALPHFLRGSLLWVGALIGEEIFDAQQRRIMADPELQPVVAQLMRIHVTEEARHIKFAREGVVHRMQYASPARAVPRRATSTASAARCWAGRSSTAASTTGPASTSSAPARGAGQPAPPRDGDRRVRVAGCVPRGERADGTHRPADVAAQRVLP